jgi:hypothetical protein
MHVWVVGSQLGSKPAVQSLSAVHSTHVPLPSHAPALGLPIKTHGVPAGEGGCVGPVKSHVSSVHGLPSSSGKSLASAAITTFPSPSQSGALQSFGASTTIFEGVPAGAESTVQTMFTQEATRQSIGAGHDDADVQPVHWPSASQVSPTPQTPPR